MAYTVQDVLDESRALLNASAGTNLFANSALQPLFNKAYTELQDALQLADIPVIWATNISATLAAGIIDYPMPADFVNPIELHEKSPSEPDVNYTLMSRVMWLPDLVAGTSFTFWQYTEQQITFLPCTISRTVRLRYYKLLPTLTSIDEVAVNNAKTWLAARTAALAAFTIGEDNDRAAALNDDANSALYRIKQLGIRNGQELRTRRRPFAIPRGYYF